MILSGLVCVGARAKLRKRSCVNYSNPSNDVLRLVSCPSPDLPKAALRILSNMTFLFVSLSYTAECAIVTAFITFIPKFIESQFGIPASNASIYTGKCYFLWIFFFFVMSLFYFIFYSWQRQTYCSVVL